MGCPQGEVLLYSKVHYKITWNKQIGHYINNFVQGSCLIHIFGNLGVCKSPFDFDSLVWLPVSVGGLDFEYACPPSQLKGDNFFSFNNRYFGLQLSRSRPVLIYMTCTNENFTSHVLDYIPPSSFCLKTRPQSVNRITGQHLFCTCRNALMTIWDEQSLDTIEEVQPVGFRMATRSSVYRLWDLTWHFLKTKHFIQRKGLTINAAMPWFIITFSCMTTLALHGSYFSHGSTWILDRYDLYLYSKRQNALENLDLHILLQPGHIYHWSCYCFL